MFSKNKLFNLVIWLTIICVTSFTIGISMVMARVDDYSQMSYKTENFELQVFDEKSAGTIEGVNEINVRSGSVGVNIIKSDSSEVKAVLSGIIKGINVAESIELNVERSKGTNGDRIEIRADAVNHFFIGVNYIKLDVYVPANYVNKLDASSSSGSVKIQGFNLTEAVLNANSGSVKADDLNVSLLYIQADSGSIRMTNVTSGKLTIKGGSGSVKLEDIAIDESINATTSSGSMKVSFKDFKGEAYMRSSSGSCNSDFPDNADLEIKASSSSGSVKCDLPIKGEIRDRSIDGIINNGRNTVEMRSSSGSVKIE